MSQFNLDVTSDMLRALIAGQSCETIGRQYGLSKSAVSQKIRLLAIDLQQIVGVLDVDEQDSPTAASIRQHGVAYQEALEHFVPDSAPALTLASLDQVSLHLGQHVAKIRRHSRCAERDTALLFTLFSTAAKPLEIAQLEVFDYIDIHGAVRASSFIRAEIAVNRAPRPLHFVDPATVAAIDAYLAHRVAAGLGIHASCTFRGLQPQSRLFLSRTGQPMRMQRAGPHRYHEVCKEIHEIYRRIFAHGGHNGINAALARRFAAHCLHMDGEKPEEIGRALGVKKLAVHKLLQPLELNARALADEPRQRRTA